MIVLFIVPFISSTQNSFNSTFKEIYLEINDMECTYDEIIIENINSNTPICLINCTFESIKTDYDGGAISIQTKNEYQEKFIFDTCIFNKCQSRKGGAIYLDIEENTAEINNCIFNDCQSSDGGSIYIIGDNSLTEITNSLFTNNRATNHNGGSIYATSNEKQNLNLSNCTIKSNSISSAIFLTKINFIFKKCNFFDNSCYDEFLPLVINCINSYGSIENSIINNNKYSRNDWQLRRDTPVYGAIYFDNVNCIFKECLFSNNEIILCYRTARGAALTGFNSNLIFEKCNFSHNHLDKERHLDYYDHLYGGAVCICNSICSFNGCLFDFNHVRCVGVTSHGGAVYFDSTNGNFTNCTFSNNYAYSGNDKSYGGAVYSLRANCEFENCLFEYNCGLSIRGSSYGGVINFDQSNGAFKNCVIKNNNVSIENTGNGGVIYAESDKNQLKTLSFENCTIVNSSAYSFQKSNGGSFYIINTKVRFINTYFINSTAFSQAFNACGGAIYNEGSSGFFENCTFFNSSAETNISQFTSTDDEPRSLGGVLYLQSSTFTFNECKFENNFCSGYSNKYDSTSYGGGIYAIASDINIKKSDFINHTLYNNGNKFEFECAIKGGACYFSESKAYLSMCNFINNTASLNATKITKYFDAKINGGAIYSGNKTLICEECTFANNYVKVNDFKEREFGGSIYLAQGKLINCSFFNNAAYNGGEIVYEQMQASFLEISNCIFIENELIKQDVKSIIQIQDSSGSSSETTNIFMNNKFVIEITTVLFDGEIKGTNINATEIKFNFNQNCISPFNEQILKTDEIIIFDEEGKEITSLESVFELQCDESELPTVPIIPTDQIITPTESIETFDTQTESDYFTTEPTEIQTDQLSPPTEWFETQTELVKTTPETTEIQTELVKTTTETTGIQTDQLSPPTEWFETQTELVKTTTETTEIQTELVKTTPEPTGIQTELVKTTPETTGIQTGQLKTPTESTVIQTEIIKTASDPTEIQTELIKTPTESLIQPTNIKTEPNKKPFKDIGISSSQLIGIICGLSSILFLTVIILGILFCIKKRRNDTGQYEDFLFNQSELDSVNRNEENNVNDKNQSISSVDPNDYFEILI